MKEKIRLQACKEFGIITFVRGGTAKREGQSSRDVSRNMLNIL